MPFPNESTQFKPGQSGNPAGYSNSRRLTARLRDMLKDEEFVRVGISEALSGDFNFWKYIFECIDGPIPKGEEAPELSMEMLADMKRVYDAHRRRAAGSGGDAGGERG